MYGPDMLCPNININLNTASSKKNKWHFSGLMEESVINLNYYQQITKIAEQYKKMFSNVSKTNNIHQRTNIIQKAASVFLHIVRPHSRSAPCCQNERR